MLARAPCEAAARRLGFQRQPPTRAPELVVQHWGIAPLLVAFAGIVALDSALASCVVGGRRRRQNCTGQGLRRSGAGATLDLTVWQGLWSFVFLVPAFSQRQIVECASPQSSEVKSPSGSWWVRLRRCRWLPLSSVKVRPLEEPLDPVVPVASSSSSFQADGDPANGSQSPRICPVPPPECANCKQGSLVYPDSSKYEGALLEGKRHGRGRLVLADGTTYSAHWRNDVRHGEGNETFPDGAKFDGGYVDGVRSGFGTMVWPEGSQYCCQFSNGRANGDGNLLRTDGSVYSGGFRDDCMTGEGCMRWRKDGIEYQGQFVGNRREGIGQMRWSSGRWRSYDGHWRDGMQHGRGALTDCSGQRFAGVFRSGKLVRWDSDVSTPGEEAEAEAKPPAYWSNQDAATGFSERAEVPPELQKRIGRLLVGTFKELRTRDRGGKMPKDLKLMKCHRVENSAMWGRYVRAQARIRARRPDGVKPVNELSGNLGDGYVRTQELLQGRYADILDASINEHYLWHGTTPEGAIGISSDGFRISFAGTHAGTYFGKGCYFSECS